MESIITTMVVIIKLGSWSLLPQGWLQGHWVPDGKTTVWKGKPVTPVTLPVCG